MELVTKEWYKTLVEECKAIITEAIFTSRWALVEGYWNLGKRIRIDDKVQEYSKGNKTFLQDLAPEIGVGVSTIYYALQAYDKYPEIGSIPEGKNITWNKLKTIYLPSMPVDQTNIQLPVGKYSTIVVDPPWPVEFMNLDMRPNQIEMPYKTMSIEEIKQWSVIKDIANEDCNLFLWTTHTYLPVALEIVKEWGFKYHVLLTWDKTNGRSLFGFNRRTEFVIFAYKGHITVNQRGKFIDTIFTEKLREHSRKPDIFYSMLLNNTPAPRIDIFSREKREGFDQWGNEVDKFKEVGNGG